MSLKNTVFGLLLLAVVSSVVTIVVWAGMMFARVPAVLAVRPELKDVGFWTGLFSGRSASYMWYHHTEPMFAFVWISTFVAIVLVVLISDGD